MGAYSVATEAALTDVVGTQGRDLAASPDTPVLHVAHDAYFAAQLDEALHLLTEKTDVRRTLYGDEADDSRIGHTPPATHEQYCSPEHESIRSCMEYMRASTPDSPKHYLPTPHPSLSPKTPNRPLEATKKRKRELADPGLPHEAATVRVDAAHKTQKREK
jgi:hypothetical protein